METAGHDPAVVVLHSSRRSRLGEHLVDVVPVDEIVDEGLEILGAQVAIVDADGHTLEQVDLDTATELVAEAGIVSKRDVNRARAVLEQLDPGAVGLIVNKVS